ncbi:MAG: hypothetical protein CVU38_18250 [Chloroflexi bacterium HGW-Chloroflexi-1]|nr:MAG: hypothetical protein CVU38_18250 [Chloroflexi bacterium HGW-Chloroflexi-1]
MLWVLCLPLAPVAWVGIVYFTGAVPPNQFTQVLFLTLLCFAVTMTTAPLVWLIARRLRISGTGDRPALALRAGFWIGLWSAVCVGLRLWGALNRVFVLTLGVILVLVEAFLQQVARQRTARR